MGEPGRDWAHELHSLWTAALSAPDDQQLDDAVLRTLRGLPGVLEARLIRHQSLPGEPPDAVTMKERLVARCTGPGGEQVELLLTVDQQEPARERLGQVLEVLRHGVTRLAYLRGQADSLSRDALLAEASVQMDAVLDASQTLHRAARMAVPAVAEGCLVYLTERTGVRRRTGVHVDVRRQAALNDDHTGGWFDALVADALAGLPATARPVPVPAVVGRSAGAHFASAQVLRARGRVLGVLVFLFDRQTRNLPDPDFLRDLTYRAALAIDNSELYEQRRRDVVTLQQHLLPAQLSAVDGVQSAAGYAVGESVLEVGGDFYDVLTRQNGGGAALIGDVCGRGVGAAALTGMARHTLGTLLQQGVSPARALAQLNTALRRDGSWRFVTTAVATFRRDAQHGLAVQLASAGHPAPIIVPRTGPIRAGTGGGIALGVRDAAGIGRSRLRLAPGDTLLMFTDGLTESRNHAGTMFEDEGLPAALEGLRTAPVQVLVDELTRAATAFRGEGTDDIAVLAIRAADPEGTDHG